MTKKKLPVRFTGQHFTIGANRSADTVLDIGAGKGFLTVHLLKIANNVVAIENDTALGMPENGCRLMAFQSEPIFSKSRPWGHCPSLRTCPKSFGRESIYRPCSSEGSRVSHRQHTQRFKSQMTSVAVC